MNLPNLVRGYTTQILVALLVLSVAANGFLWFSLRNAWEREGGLAVALETQKQESREAKSANDGLMLDIAALIASKEELLELWAADKGQASREISAREAQIEAANNRAEEERGERYAVSKKPTCRAFLDGVVGDFCPELAAGLRDRSRNAPGGLRDGQD